jgi:RND superfamily putative drug exporter
MACQARRSACPTWPRWALGEDYNILVMTRIREEATSLRLRDAVSHALAATGTTVTSAGLVLAGTFGIFALVGARTAGGGQFTNLAVGSPWAS